MMVWLCTGTKSVRSVYGWWLSPTRLLSIDGLCHSDAVQILAFHFRLDLQMTRIVMEVSSEGLQKMDCHHCVHRDATLVLSRTASVARNLTLASSSSSARAPWVDLNSLKIHGVSAGAHGHLQTISDAVLYYLVYYLGDWSTHKMVRFVLNVATTALTFRRCSISAVHETTRHVLTVSRHHGFKLKSMHGDFGS